MALVVQVVLVMLALAVMLVITVELVVVAVEVALFSTEIQSQVTQELVVIGIPATVTVVMLVLQDTWITPITFITQERQLMLVMLERLADQVALAIQVTPTLEVVEVLVIQVHQLTAMLRSFHSRQQR